jgi:hypothetical protein
MANSKPKRRWYQFSLRTLLVVMVVFIAGIGSIGVRMNRARINRGRLSTAISDIETGIQIPIAKLESIGVRIHFLYEDQRSRTWLENLFDDPGYPNPVSLNVEFSGTNATDADMAQLKQLSDVRAVGVSNTNIADGGLEHLKGLTNLVYLDVKNTIITDDGLLHLKEFAKLEYLNLSGTNVTDEGVKKLQQALPNCKIISDASLE